MTTPAAGYRGLDERIAARGGDSVWSGDQVRLRAREPGDADGAPPVTSSADERSSWMVFPPRSQTATRKLFEEWADQRLGPDTLEFALAIARHEDNLMVGDINVHSADRANGTFSYGVSVYPEHKGNGYAAEAIVLVLRFMFGERRFHKCEAQVYDFNPASLSLHRKLGFVEEGRLRGHLFRAGGYHDELIFGMTADEFSRLYPKLQIVL